MPTDTSSPGRRPAPSFSATLTRVLAVQVVTLVLLWVLQTLYHA